MIANLRNVLWWDTLAPELTEPLGRPLDCDTEADVVIVGAGFTGLWTAYYLQSLLPGASIAIVERHIAGFGASGRNGGWVSALFPQGDLAIARQCGVEAARAMRTAMNSTLVEIGRVIDEHGWDVDWAHGGTVIAARTHAQAVAMHADHAAQVNAGLDPNDELLDREQTRALVNATDIRAGAFTRHCAVVQPAKLVRHLARHVVKRGARLFEGTPATSIEPGVVRTHRGRIRARYVVRATEGYTGDLHGQRRTLLPFYSLMVATEPLPESTWSEIGLHDRPSFADARHLVIYGQRTADGRLAFGGRGAPYTFGSRINARVEVDSPVHQKLRTILTDMFPVLRQHSFTHAWGGTLGIARDWWASVGLDHTTGMGWSGGYVGDGVGTSNLGGRTLATLIAGSSDEEITSLPWVDHRSRSWEVEPFRWLGTSIGLRAMSSADRIEARTGRPSKRSSLVGRFVGH